MLASILLFMSACSSYHLADGQTHKPANPQNLELAEQLRRAEIEGVFVSHLASTYQVLSTNEGYGHNLDSWPALSTLQSNLEARKQSVYSLTSSQKARFDRFFYSEENAHIPAHKRFSQYLETRLLDFTYHGATYDAATAFEKMSGNCLSLAILTTALAKHVGLEIRYQRINSAPVYSKHGNILLLSTHVRTRVYQEELPRKKNTFTSRGFVTIDYFPARGDVSGEMIDSDEFMGMYYRNLAAQALIEKQAVLAFKHISDALAINIEDPESLNLLALLAKQSGDVFLAKSIYKDMLSLNVKSLNAIENYANLLFDSGDTKLANQLLTLLPETLNEDNPYQWLSIATRHYNSGNMRLALQYAQKAAEKAPYIHEPFYLMAKVYFKTDKFGASRQALEQASSLSNTREQERLYLSKLNALSGM